MAFDFQRARPLLQSGNLTKLFVEELGWEHCRQKLTLRAGETDYAFNAVAEKRGFTAWLCASADGKLPDHATRLKLDRALTQTNFEHLIVFATKDYAQQSWMWVRREPGRPLRAIPHEYSRNQSGDSLLQKLQILYVSLEEEEKGELSTITMAERGRAAFDIERVTKAFYRDFDTHRKAFLKFIDGIGEVADCEWYASVMLNRLMFVYFIQRKGFLDGDHNYLRNRLDRCKKEQGQDKFYTFYRYFLLRLFHEGFGKRRKDRAPDLEKLLGNIPYLNGGLFDVHELEKPERYGKNIQISDKAFVRVFDYFDQYQWHLDERPLRNDNEINPDVLGYIFEKYINQKQMGAYYTKEDITEYISKNTVLPFLFDAARARCKVAFENPNGPTVWDLLRENPDRYVYEAVKKGVASPLPKDIEAGIKDVSKRDGWNRPALAEHALSTEIWREVVSRRQRYEEVRKKLAAAEVHEVNDFITLNLDLRQFAQDVIQNCEGPDLLMAFWQAIATITVLDPAGGSGAFIFAALNILEPLYEACLDRMEAFLTEWGENGRKIHPNYHKKFAEVLARVDAHPNRRYFVLKSIILNNLYAVDLMEEAAEICKLRLFLKLAAQVDPKPDKDNLGIEPLPDIDFNIRTGNTLVGYATKEEVQRCMKELGGGQMKLMGEDELGSFARFNTRCADVEQAFSKFRQLQTEGDGSVPVADKQELQKRLKALEEELNRHLAGEYNVKVTDKVAYAKWVKSHQPFHWFIQFYGILNGGGFDVIIGNPPYVELNALDDYQIRGYACAESGNLYALIMERCAALGRKDGHQGYIVPVSSVSTDRYETLQSLVVKRETHFSSYDDRPSRLFDGLEHIRLTIHLIGRPVSTPQLFSTRYNKWMAEERPALFSKLTFTNAMPALVEGTLPKLCSDVEQGIVKRLAAQQQKLCVFYTAGAKHKIYYSRKVGYFLQVLDFEPRVLDGKGKRRPPSEFKELKFTSDDYAKLALCCLNSNLFYWFITVFSDCRHVNKREVDAFPINLLALSEGASKKQLIKLATALMDDLQQHSENRVMRFQHDTLTVQCIYPKASKSIIDEIDTVLAGHYRFTAEELDFILNYDIKYRLGRDAETEDEGA
jgi:Eco57I restriction-modification methylase